MGTSSPESRGIKDGRKVGGRPTRRHNPFPEGRWPAVGPPSADRFGLESPPRTRLTDFTTIQQGLWDRFIDTLDLAGQEGRISDVVVPKLAVDIEAGKLFGELTRDEVENLSKQASKVGRRADVVLVMWQDMQRKKKPTQKKGLQPRK